jgi:putative nucleotidyltransferase with HDIG domain
MASASTDLEHAAPLYGADDDSRFFAVPLTILVGLAELRCDIYIQYAGASRKMLYKSANADLPAADAEKLRRRNVRHLFLRVEDRQAYDLAVGEALARPINDPSVQLALTVDQHREAFQCAMRGRSAAQVVTAAKQVGDDVLQIIKQDNFSVGMAVTLLDHDQCTFQHSCNVAIYSAALARSVGMADEDLKLLTSGGVLHDIGKRHIPTFILKKPGRLDDRERELVRQHPATGFRELAALGQLTWAQLMMAYQHHEWINGLGYPVGITGDEMHPWARICAVADVFDALTANRPYREAGHARSALQTMKDESGHFDKELFKQWTELVAS